MGGPQTQIRVRRADVADTRSLRRFCCDRGGWFARDVQGLIRGRVATAVDPVNVLLFEREDDLVAVAALEIDPIEPSICEIYVVALANDHQGSDVQTVVGRQPLVKVVLDTALAFARNLAATHARTIVARDNSRSIRMLVREGFVRLEAFDRDYDEYIARLA